MKIEGEKKSCKKSKLFPAQGSLGSVSGKNWQYATKSMQDLWESIWGEINDA